jgi:hypothetical protein
MVMVTLNAFIVSVRPRFTEGRENICFTYNRDRTTSTCKQGTVCRCCFRGNQIENYHSVTRPDHGTERHCLSRYCSANFGETIPTERPPPVGAKLVPTFFLRIEGVAWSVPRIPTAVNLDFLDPEPLLLRKSGSAGNRTRNLWICSQEL